MIKIHNDLVKISGEELDILSENKLKLILRKYRNSKSLVEKVAILLHDIPYFQPFSEGNKRTAFFSLKIFIELNNWHLIASNKELEHIILRSVNNNITLNGVEVWLRKKIVRLQKRNL